MSKSRRGVGAAAMGWVRGGGFFSVFYLSILAHRFAHAVNCCKLRVGRGLGCKARLCDVMRIVPSRTWSIEYNPPFEPAWSIGR